MKLVLKLFMIIIFIFILLDINCTESAFDEINSLIDQAYSVWDSDQELCAQVCFKIIDKAQSSDYYLAEVTALQILSDIQLQSGFYQDALNYAERALSVKIKNDLPNLHIDYYRLGSINYSIKQYKVAAEYFKKGLEDLQNYDKPNMKAGLLSMLSKSYRFQHRFDDALDVLFQLQNENQTTLPISGILNNIGDIYEIKGEYKKAEEYYTTAMEKLDGSEIGINRALLYANLANIKKYYGDYNKSIELLNVGLELAELENDHTSLSFIYLSYYGLFNVMGKFDKAMEYGNLLSELYKPDTNYNIKDYASTAEFKLKQSESSSIQEGLQSTIAKLHNRIIVLILSAIVLILGIVLYFVLKIKQKEIGELLLKEEKARLELNSLQSRINPHFLFNALNSTSTLIKKIPSSAEEMIQNISEFLRYSLISIKKQKVTLSEELDIAKRYLEIEKIRFGKRLDYLIQLDNNLDNYSIPPMVIQPLVENSIKHGISNLTENGKISVSCLKKDNRVHISVVDNGETKNNYSEKNCGFGLEYIHKKLKYFFKNDFDMSISSNSGFSVTLSLPYGGSNV